MSVEFNGTGSRTIHGDKVGGDKVDGVATSQSDGITFGEGALVTGGNFQPGDNHDKIADVPEAVDTSLNSRMDSIKTLYDDGLPVWLSTALPQIGNMPLEALVGMDWQELADQVGINYKQAGKLVTLARSLKNSR